MSESLTDTSDTPQHQPEKAIPRLGEVLSGRYKIKDIVLESESGNLWEARDLSDNRPVLIEIINTSIPSGLPEFERLAKECIQFEHENILKLIAYEEFSGRPFFVWEFVDFVRLEDLIETGGFIEQESEIFDTISQICHGLQYAHEKGVAHGYLHPRNICLADVEGDVVIKIANFGLSHLQHQLRSFETAGVFAKPKPENDLYQLSVLTYFIVTGESPSPGKSLDHILDPRTLDKVSFETLIDLRSDMRSFEELLQLLEDSIDPDANWRIKSAKEFEDGLIDWHESAKSSLLARSEVAEKVAEDKQQAAEPTTEKKRKITNNMRTTVKQMVNLKTKQSNQEETAVMKLTNIASARGPRKSPMASLARLSLALLAVLAVTGAALYGAFYKPDQVKNAWLTASEQIAALTRPKKEAYDLADIDPVNVPVLAERPDIAKLVPLESNPDEQKPATRLPAFDHNVLNDLYRKDFATSNNQTRRAFRIDYREWKDEWISK